jgi:hypothetical protein
LLFFIIKKWISGFTILHIPCKFQQNQLKKVAVGLNGLSPGELSSGWSVLGCKLCSGRQKEKKNYQKWTKGLPKKNPAISFLQETKGTIV